ncbi:hypothetical protein QA612_17925 [Evansella sp. AB-P1]|uniref:hypothetical protein n=1 Tax=Evansella sp. AB-P1 TaxID=3037653 RepID=UPI00241CF2FC|nr:hypothetical protein [Evansella sp. AB-P1]MDG5789343.1 hypothetical protein [Evansella sp. AB-P1]
MRRLVFIQYIFFISIFGLFACGTDNSSESNRNERTQDTEETKEADDFEVSINVENDDDILEVYATITYIGEEDKADIYHGGSIFFFNLYEINGEFEYLGGMDQPLLTTTLQKDEIHKVEFTDPVLNELGPGGYEFEAIAHFSLDGDNIIDTKIEIPVSKIVKIE